MFIPLLQLVGELTSMKSLDANSNKLTTLPAEMGSLAGLEELLLYKNKIKTVDPAIGQLKKLKVLNLFNQGVLAKLPWPRCVDMYM